MANQYEKARHRLRRHSALRFGIRRYKLIVSVDWCATYYQGSRFTKIRQSSGYLRDGHVASYSILGSRGKTRRKLSEYGPAYRSPVRDLRKAMRYVEFWELDNNSQRR